MLDWRWIKVSSGKLSHVKIAKLSQPGMWGDGDGLWLFATALKSGSLSRRFVFRYRVKGRYGEVPIGPWPSVTLADARARAAEFRAMIARGDDPAGERKAAKGKARTPAIGAHTFKAATIDYVEVAGKRWRTAAHAQEFLEQFRAPCLPPDWRPANRGGQRQRGASGLIALVRNRLILGGGFRAAPKPSTTGRG